MSEDETRPEDDAGSDESSSSQEPQEGDPGGSPDAQETAETVLMPAVSRPSVEPVQIEDSGELGANLLGGSSPAADESSSGESPAPEQEPPVDGAWAESGSEDVVAPSDESAPEAESVEEEFVWDESPSIADEAATGSAPVVENMAPSWETSADEAVSEEPAAEEPAAEEPAAEEPAAEEPAAEEPAADVGAVAEEDPEVTAASSSEVLPPGGGFDLDEDSTSAIAEPMLPPHVGGGGDSSGSGPGGGGGAAGDDPPGTGAALGLSLFATLCCGCLPVGAYAVFLAFGAKTAVDQGDYETARSKIKTSYMVSGASVLVGACLGVGWLIFSMLVAPASSF